MLGGLMMADHAARSGAKQAMVTCKMPGNAADDGAFEATLGRSGR